MQIIPVKTPIFRENNNLVNFIFDNIPPLNNSDIIAVTSKIVALSQGRTGKLKNKEELIIGSSKRIIKTPWALLTLINDDWCINAGVDESNGNHKVVLLPNNIFKTAETIRTKLMKHFCLKKLGVLITDTKSLPLRVGTIGRAVAYAGFQSLKSYIGKKDLFGKKSRLTKSNIADALSASAVLVMGEGSEQTPIAIIKNAPVNFTSKKRHTKNGELSILPNKDIYSYLYKDRRIKK
ncbi:MAG: coenzyme F420-0:L-glutamate ligase [Patescibacteria group bacterium]|nr:coenzyme F420-0:L-glutamate ligase [Patescibacteria group bacterium]